MQDPDSDQRTLTISLAGMLGTIALAIVIAGCIRLGFWQLDRLEQRRTRNHAIAERMDAAALEDFASLRDTAGIVYRTAIVRGVFDNDHAVVLPGRSHRGAPGVYLLTPLRTPGGKSVLVNRGWVPSADAATIEADALAQHGSIEIRGIIVPFPTRAQSLAQRGGATSPDSGFRRIWYVVDEQALRQQFPYALLPAMLQALPAPDVSGYPTRLDAPALDEGPHLGYALQWFSFAIIGVIGWVALVLRGRSATRRRAHAVTATVLASLAAAMGRPAAAQLRPLEPVDWRVYEPGTLALAALGAGSLWDQTAALAGSRGRLLELGNYSLLLRVADRVALEFAGTAMWRLTDEIALEPAVAGVNAPNGSARQDPGFASIATSIDLTPRRSAVDLLLRFGTRLPTTSDESGLDRDRTDFFALLGGRYRIGPLALTAESGLGVHGTTRADYPQSDVWAFAFGAEYSHGPIATRAQLVGHQDGRSRRVRGNEDLREVRFGIRLGSKRSLDLAYIHGLSDFSPANGIRLAGGVRVGGGQPGKRGL